jgi:hypothetical protein
MPDPRMIVPRVKGEPATIQKHLVPCAKVHGGRISWNADVAEVARALAGRNVHATGQRHSKMGEVPADAAAFLMSLRCGAVPSRVMVAEFDAVVGAVTDRLRSLPATLDTAKERPGQVRKPLVSQ